MSYLDAIISLLVLLTLLEGKATDFSNFTLCEATTLRTNFLQSDTSDEDLDITTQGTGVVKLDDQTQLTLTGSF